jgi:glutathione S-transferase
VWLLEELNVPYEIHVYKRTKDFRAPKELDEVHPLGKSPVIEIISSDGERKIIAESGHIFSYMIRHYDKENKLGGDNEEVDYFLHYTEGSFQWLHVGLLINDIAGQTVPWGVSHLLHGILGIINSYYYIPEVYKNLQFLESILEKQHKENKEYIVGDKLTAADIILSYPVSNFYVHPEVSARIFGKKFDAREAYPNLYRWYQHIEKQPKLIKANESITNLGDEL